MSEFGEQFQIVRKSKCDSEIMSLFMAIVTPVANSDTGNRTVRKEMTTTIAVHFVDRHHQSDIHHTPHVAMTNTNVIALSDNNDPIRIAVIVTMADTNDMNVKLVKTTKTGTTTDMNATSQTLALVNVVNLMSLMKTTEENVKNAKIKLNLPRRRSLTDLT